MQLTGEKNFRNPEKNCFQRFADREDGPISRLCGEEWIARTTFAASWAAEKIKVWATAGSPEFTAL